MKFERYDCYKDSKIELLGKVPNLWEITTIKIYLDIFLLQMKKKKVKRLIVNMFDVMGKKKL